MHVMGHNNQEDTQLYAPMQAFYSELIGIVQHRNSCVSKETLESKCYSHQHFIPKHVSKVL